MGCGGVTFPGRSIETLDNFCMLLSPHTATHHKDGKPLLVLEQKALCAGVQLASLSSAAVFTSGALFVYYCSAGAVNMAAWQPLLVYGGLLAFLLFPNNVVYKVCPFDRANPSRHQAPLLAC